MVAVHMFTALAQKETAKQAILKQLREAGATSAPMPGSVEHDGEEAEAALAELMAAGTVREARPGLYFVDEAAGKESKPSNGFIALLAILVLASFAASLIAIASTAG